MDANKRFWDHTAKLYTGMQERSNRDVYDAVLPRCRPYIQGKRVLELACGSGQFTVPLCGDAAEWEATDYSANMLREAEKRTAGAHFSVQDATALPQPDGSFDVVLVGNALHIMPEPGLALAEILRVLRPGGVLLAPTFVYEGKIKRGRLRLMKLAGFHAYYEWTKRDLEQVLRQAGFSLLESELVSGPPLPEAFVAAQKRV